MYIALSIVELFGLAEATKELTKSLRLQEMFGFIKLDDELAWKLAQVENLVEHYIGEDTSGVAQKEISYYNGE